MFVILIQQETALGLFAGLVLTNKNKNIIIGIILKFSRDKVLYSHGT